MRIWALLGAIVELLDDDDFLAGVATLKGYCDLGILNNLVDSYGKTTSTFPGLKTRNNSKNRPERLRYGNTYF